MDNNDAVAVEDCEFDGVINTLVNLFGDVLSKDVISAVVENCGGDLNISAEAIMNITNESGASSERENSDIQKISTTLPTIQPTTNDSGNLINLEEIENNGATFSMFSYSESLNTSNQIQESVGLRDEMDSILKSSESDLQSTAMRSINNKKNFDKSLNPEPSGILAPLPKKATMHNDIITSTEQIAQNSECLDVLSSARKFTDLSVSNAGDSCQQTEMTSNMQVDADSKGKEPTMALHSNDMVISLDANNSLETLTQSVQPQTSYARISSSTGAFPKQATKEIKSAVKINWTSQLGEIVKNHNQGYRILIIMRGVPGSGKSYLAKQVIQVTVGDNIQNYKTHILSTDDYFSLNGTYKFDKFYLSDAHAWNQNRAKVAMRKAVSPLIIDNTNVEIWEMDPYVREGVNNGYIIEVMEPKTPWAKKPNQLFKRNEHGVSMTTIVKMLDKFRENITGDFLITACKLVYPATMIPPVMRKYPAVVLPKLQPSLPVDSSLGEISKSQFNESYNPQLFQKNDQNAKSQECVLYSPQFSQITEDKVSQQQPPAVNVVKEEAKDISPSYSEISFEQQKIAGDIKSEINSQSNFISCDSLVNEENEENSNHSESNDKSKYYLEIEKQLEEIEKVEREWENNEGWDDEAKEMGNIKKEDVKNEIQTSYAPKPPRKAIENQPSLDDKLMKSFSECQDWRQISLFMPSWTDIEALNSEKPEEVPVEMKSSSTCMEIGDTDTSNTNNIFKIISATPRNINQFYVSQPREKIPDKHMLDKSSMTNEQSITEAYRCKNEERHFIAFRKMFKNISKVALRDIFDQCCGDVNWAVEIVLDGMANNQLETVENEELSDVEELSEQCGCLAAYNIIPDTEVSRVIPNNIPEAIPTNLPTNINHQLQRKAKRELPISDTTMQLKRQIEQNVVISDNHYSEHCLKIRKFRRGELGATGEVEDSKQMENAHALNLDLQATCAQAQALDCSDDEDSSNSSIDDIEKVVSINVGREFITQLDELFGRKELTYPETVAPKISIPLSLLNEINALWMESLMYQLDEYDKQSALMLQQDEEFARQLALKELELAKAGKEPEVPDFKEIMDMDFAISLYQKDVAEEWRNKEPSDMAAKLTRDKLYNLFPELPQETLAELLMAHENNFQMTVEVLLMSTGKSDILEEKNGLNKFVMQKEMERQERLIEEEKKALSEVEWPLLPRGEVVEMSVVTGYRDEAEKHLQRRNINYQKAQEYIRRGMTQVANYYSDVAAFHKQKFDHANSLAAASLIQVHASRNPDNATIDLHYLRVAEAKESLDLFLDTHIQKLKESQSQNRGPRQHTLYFITGRGLHSNGGPKVKPAVKRRLRERGLIYSERNPGLLTAKVSADDKLSYQVQVP